jgi:peptidoglycan lytic transglycosylase G
MKRFIILSGILIAVVLFGIVAYYKFDPSLLAKLSFYQNLANPSMRIIKIPEGLRKEEIAEVFGEKLEWDEKEKLIFENLSLDSEDREGRYYPQTYIIYKDEDPTVVGTTMFNAYTKEIEKITKKKPIVLNEDTIIKIASIIQREAAGKEDMNLISGILWNRLADRMKLQIDATLQYAKGNVEDGWWEEVDAKDKKIQSPYNTYIHAGVPPSAIANPGADAIAAAYNPKKTSCLFYLHDKGGLIHCTKTYAEHKKNVERYLK